MSFNLAIENRPGEFIPIDIKILDNTLKGNFNMIEEIDRFTKNYTHDEIIAMVRKNNLVPLNFLRGELKIINDSKYRYEILYKDTSFSLDTFFEKNISNKQIMNKFLNVYLKYADNKDEMQKEIINENINGILQHIFKLPYLDVRSIYLYLSHIE